MKTGSAHKPIDEAANGVSQQLANNARLDSPDAFGQVPLQVKDLGQVRTYGFDELSHGADGLGQAFGRGVGPSLPPQGHQPTIMPGQFFCQGIITVGFISQYCHLACAFHPPEADWGQGGVMGVGRSKDEVGYPPIESD
jgi:hypothetical protein